MGSSVNLNRARAHYCAVYYILRYTSARGSSDTLQKQIFWREIGQPVPASERLWLRRCADFIDRGKRAKAQSRFAKFARIQRSQIRLPSAAAFYRAGCIPRAAGAAGSAGVVDALTPLNHNSAGAAT